VIYGRNYNIRGKLIESEVDESANLERLIQKFEEMSLNIRPFIEERGLARV